MTKRERELQDREAAVLSREVAVSQREAAVTARERYVPPQPHRPINPYRPRPWWTPPIYYSGNVCEVG